MSRHRGRTSGALAAIMGVVLATTLCGSVSATPPTPASGAIWETGNLEYRWGTGMEPPSWLRPALHAAADDASVTTKAGTPNFTFDVGGAGWIGYTEDIPTDYAVGYAVRNVPTGFGIRLRPHGYALQWGTLRWCQYYDGTPPNGCYDAEMITLHEFGHVLTLGHPNEDTVTDWADTIMHTAPKTKAKAGWNAHEFGRCDVARLQLRYEAASPLARISTCLNIDTSLSLAVSPGTTIDYGSSASVSAVLRMTSASYADSLAGDPLSGRAVWLQRRPIGATSWVDLAQMSAGTDPGRYVRTLPIYASYEYRARFRAPDNEGLGAATSNILRISVADPCVSSNAIDGINAPTC